MPPKLLGQLRELYDRRGMEVETGPSFADTGSWLPGIDIMVYSFTCLNIVELATYNLYL